MSNVENNIEHLFHPVLVEGDVVLAKELLARRHGARSHEALDEAEPSWICQIEAGVMHLLVEVIHLRVAQL